MIQTVDIMALVLLLWALFFELASAIVQGPTDYCMTDKFQPSCNQNEVVMIETALYGRMKPGKCFPAEQGNFECSANVQNLMDSFCSGKSTCSINPMNEDLILTQPCTPGFLGYLSVSYSCIKVDDTQGICTTGQNAKIEANNGYLSSKHHTSRSCPIEITAPTQKLLKFTIYNFMKKTGSACYEVAVIKEKENQKSVHVCQSDPRTKQVMMTSSSHVTVHFSEFQIGESVGGFLLHFEAVGCPKPDIPVGAHMERKGDRAKIKCNNSDSSWFIYCKDTKWTEMDRKCPQDDWSISKIFKSKGGFPYGIFLTSFIAVGIGIFLGGFLLFMAINAFQRHQRRLRQAYEAPPIIPDPDYKIYDTCKMDLNFVPGFGTAGRHTIARHQMSPPPVPLQPPEDERRFSRHTYEKPKYNSTDNSPFVEA